MSSRADVLVWVRRHALVVAYLVALVPAIAMAVAQPVWSLVDEAAHYDFIVQLAHGVYPVADTTLIAPETLQISQKTGVYRAFYPPGSYPTPDLSDIALPPSGMSDSANALWMQRHMWQLSREAIQTPGYYALMVPVWWVADALGGPFAALYALRIVNALLVAALAPMTIVAARLLMPGRPEVVLPAAVFAILLPGLVLNLTRVSNDTPAAVLGGLVVLLALRWAGTEWTWRRVAFAGALLGAGMLVKLTTAALFPVLALAILWPRGAMTAGDRGKRVAFAGALALLFIVPWFVLNLHIYGGLTSGARGVRVSDAVPHGLTADFLVQDAAVFLLTYWSGEPWGALPFSAGFAVLGMLIALMVPPAIVKVLRKPDDPVRRPLAIAVVAVAVMVAMTLTLPATFGFEFLGPGRYAYAALPAATALCAVGLWTVLSRKAGRALLALYGVVAGAMLTAGALGLPPQPAPGPGIPPPGARIAQVDATGQFRSMTITVDQVARDSSGRATWFHVIATNTGSDEIEWTVPGDYLSSTHLPGDLDPDATVSGWLYVPGNPTTLHFTGIAAGEYQAVGSIDIAVSLT